MNLIASKTLNGPADHSFTIGSDQKIFIRIEGFSPTDNVFVGIGQGSQLAKTDVFNWALNVSDVPKGEYFLRAKKNDEREIGFVVYVKDAEESSEYTTLVSSRDRSWQNRFNPNSPAVAVENGKLFMNPSMGSADGSMRITKFKIYIPKGTTSFQATSYLYIDNNMTPGVALVKFGSHPDVNYPSMDGNNSKRNIFEGLQFKFTSPQASLKLTTEFDAPFKVEKGGYLYVHLISAPAGIMMELNAGLQIDYDEYLTWYEAAGFAEDGSPL